DIEAQVELNPGAANGGLSALVDRQFLGVRPGRSNQLAEHQMEEDKHDTHDQEHEQVTDECGHTNPSVCVSSGRVSNPSRSTSGWIANRSCRSCPRLRARVTLTLGCVRHQLLTSCEPGVDLMPVGDIRLSHLPAQVNLAVLHPAREVNQPLVGILEL